MPPPAMPPPGGGPSYSWPGAAGGEDKMAAALARVEAIAERAGRAAAGPGAAAGGGGWSAPHGADGAAGERGAELEAGERVEPRWNEEPRAAAPAPAAAPAEEEEEDAGKEGRGERGGDGVARLQRYVVAAVKEAIAPHYKGKEGPSHPRLSKEQFKEVARRATDKVVKEELKLLPEGLAGHAGGMAAFLSSKRKANIAKVVAAYVAVVRKDRPRP
jgi:hypothetical protein